MLGKLTAEEMEQLLKNHFIGHLACHADGQTYLVPISYAYDGSYVFCHAEEGKKLEMMRKNPSVCFEVDELEDMANWKSVVAWGEFEELTNGEDRKTALEALLDRPLPFRSSITTHLGSTWPFKPKDTEQIPGVVFRIAIKKKTGRFEENEWPGNRG